jgi:hypothetical protein
MQINISTLILSCIVLSNVAFSGPIEVVIEPGSYVIAYFNTPGNPELLTPITKFTHSLPRFAGESAIMTINLQLEDQTPTLHLNRVMEKYKIASCRAWFNLVDNKGYLFSKGASLQGIKISKENECMIITQKFTHVDFKRDNELVIVIAPCKDKIEKRVKIPKSFMLWSWDFPDTFDYLDKALMRKK